MLLNCRLERITELRESRLKSERYHPMPSKADVQHLLRKMLSTFEAADIAADHPWACEKDRWTELVFALLTRIATLPENSLRVLVYRSRNLGLLDIHTLAGKTGKGNYSSTSNARMLVELFKESG